MSVRAMRCLTSAAWLTSGRFKSFWAKAAPVNPRMAIQRVDGLGVFIILYVVESLPFSDFRAFRHQIIVSLSPSLINARAGANCAQSPMSQWVVKRKAHVPGRG